MVLDRCEGGEVEYSLNTRLRVLSMSQIRFSRDVLGLALFSRLSRRVQGDAQGIPSVLGSIGSGILRSHAIPHIGSFTHSCADGTTVTEKSRYLRGLGLMSELWSSSREENFFWGGNRSAILWKSRIVQCNRRRVLGRGRACYLSNYSTRDFEVEIVQLYTLMRPGPLLN
ncbi:uncharacterized protein BT62DRAFT_687666 [Guyanagaster necrorhizus]|uniref:Uncharacterized protein n=1 Tax=Guyanagaster necrorhizus TaxID=856835 RepID=A0A9P7VH46_9AGAR|nr:uncharacterized protein BT62DRAFT_687666 [Guyanagaster necrorhizus MCA 3950]KAG7439859.1 hypothetical protein BT62DRAFT_687666 [Guyanagaster necrorhizus MCA 3950]